MYPNARTEVYNRKTGANVSLEKRCHSEKRLKLIKKGKLTRETYKRKAYKTWHALENAIYPNAITEVSNSKIGANVSLE